MQRKTKQVMCCRSELTFRAMCAKKFNAYQRPHLISGMSDNNETGRRQRLFESMICTASKSSAHTLRIVFFTVSPALQMHVFGSKNHPDGNKH